MSSQQQQQADSLFIKDFNDSRRLEARYVSTGFLFALLVFTFWDIQYLGTDHPLLYSLMTWRFAISGPVFLYAFYASYPTHSSPRLDWLITLGLLCICLTTVQVHYFYYQINIYLPIDSILLCAIVVYFVPNIFFMQKLLVGIVLTIFYISYLAIIEQVMYEFIRASVYLGMLNLAGVIHSISFDRQRRSNFDKTQFLKEMAKTDQLTGAENRHRFDERFIELLEQARSENQGIAVAITDIDFFKQYNDHYGHFTGDECLIKVAQAFLTMKRHPLDSCIRFGGEEFILIKYGVTFEESISWGQKIISTIQKLNIPHAKSTIDHRLTVSTGLIHWLPSSNLTRTQLMKLADDALYKAKANGRNQVHVHLTKEKTQ